MRHHNINDSKPNLITIILVIAVVVLALFGKPLSGSSGGGVSEDEVEKIVENYIQDNPDKVLAALRNSQNRQRQQDSASAGKKIKENKAKLFEDKTSPVLGNKNAQLAIVQFFDYSCGYCKKATPDIQKLADNLKDVKIIFKEFPILGPQSELSAKAATAVHLVDKSKYWKYHQALMKMQGAKTENTLLKEAEKLGLSKSKVKTKMNSKEVADIIQENRKLGTAIGVRGTPAFIIGEELIPGAIGYDAIKSKIDKLKKS